MKFINKYGSQTVIYTVPAQLILRLRNFDVNNDFNALAFGWTTSKHSAVQTSIVKIYLLIK
jgi:hypothetical protein